MFHGSSQYTAQPLLYTKSSQRLSVIDTRVENTPGLCRLPPAGSRSIAALVTSVIIVYAERAPSLQITNVGILSLARRNRNLLIQVLRGSSNTKERAD